MDEFDREKTLGAGAEEPVDSTRDDHSTPQHREQPLPWYRTELAPVLTGHLA